MGDSSRFERVYLAARTINAPLMREWRSVLGAAGYLTTSRWIDQAFDPPSLMHLAARRDWDDLKEADAVLLHNPEEQAFEGHGGRHVETGLALGMGKSVVIVGQRSNVFHYLREVIVVDGIETAVAVLNLKRDQEIARQRTINLRPWNIV